MRHGAQVEVRGQLVEVVSLFLYSVGSRDQSSQAWQSPKTVFLQRPGSIMYLSGRTLVWRVRGQFRTPALKGKHVSGPMPLALQQI